MMRMSKIEWTDVTWNPVAGCSIATARACAQLPRDAWPPDWRRWAPRNIEA